jgi:hypothetical protein
MHFWRSFCQDYLRPCDASRISRNAGLFDVVTDVTVRENLSPMRNDGVTGERPRYGMTPLSICNLPSIAGNGREKRGEHQEELLDGRQANIDQRFWLGRYIV